MTTNSEACALCHVDHHEPGAPRCKVHLSARVGTSGATGGYSGAGRGEQVGSHCNAQRERDDDVRALFVTLKWETGRDVLTELVKVGQWLALRQPATHAQTQEEADMYGKFYKLLNEAQSAIDQFAKFRPVRISDDGMIFDATLELERLRKQRDAAIKRAETLETVNRASDCECHNCGEPAVRFDSFHGSNATVSEIGRP